MATLHELSEDALVEILTRPKNALVRQYQRLFDFENVKLEFTDEALHAVAQQAIERKAGARGLRSILEHIMLDVMYEIPSQTNIRKCIVTEDVVRGRGASSPRSWKGRKPSSPERMGGEGPWQTARRSSRCFPCGTSSCSPHGGSPVRRAR